MATLKEAKAAKAAKDLAEAKAALDEAHAAATKAFLDFKKTAKIAKEGYIIDSCGYADVVVYKPSYRLRTTLKALGEIEKSHGGAWSVSNFTKSVKEQSITANEVACQAACEVLKRRFPGEGEFFATSRMD
jgi:hypothetical protein